MAECKHITTADEILIFTKITRCCYQGCSEG